MSEQAVPTPAEPLDIIDIVNLSKRFKSLDAVRSLTMSVRKGEIFGFLGPNGAGKSTTIKMIMGLTRPTAGDIWINGKRACYDTVEYRQEIGYLPERIAFYDNLTAVQTLKFFCELKGAGKSIVRPLLKDVGLEGAGHRKLGTFSKGMRQLVGIAQAMIGNPSIYIFDEPTSGLDIRWVKLIREQIKHLKKLGATIIFSSHILSEVQNLCDRVAVINEGRLIALDTIANLNEVLEIRPRLEIDIPGLNGRVPVRIGEIDGVDSIEVNNEVLSITCRPSARAKILTVLETTHVPIRDFRTIEPSIEETFVKLLEQQEV